MLSTKLAIRLARRWQNAWAAARPAPANHDNSWYRVASRFDFAQETYDRFAFVAARQCPVASKRLAQDLVDHLAELSRAANLFRDDLLAKRSPTVSLGDWLADVRQLEAEFGEVEVKWKDQVVRAVTDPITLRHIELGPFAIDFHWDRLGASKGVNCFDFIALEPNPAAGRDEVVHPHVQGQDLCSGDAAGPVQRALEQGRIAEAFLLLRSVLTTYNSSSPYVPLDQWSGRPCRECGSRVEDEDSYACESCDADLCERCAGSCAACLSSRCGACLDECALCNAYCCSGCLEHVRDDERICTRCFAVCAQCGRRMPKDELTDRLCPDCHTPDEEIDDDDVDDEPEPVALGEG